MRKIVCIFCICMSLLLVGCSKIKYTVVSSGKVVFDFSNSLSIGEKQVVIKECESKLVVIDNYEEYKKYSWLSGENSIEEDFFEENYLFLNVIKASMYEIEDLVYLEEIEFINETIIITYSVDEQYYYNDGLYKHHDYMYFFIGIPKNEEINTNNFEYGLKFYDRYYKEEGSRYYRDCVNYFPIIR